VGAGGGEKHHQNKKMIIQLLTGIFATAAVATGFLVITAKNPIISVFYLVLTFVNASILLLIQGVEFFISITYHSLCWCYSYFILICSNDAKYKKSRIGR